MWVRRTHTLLWFHCVFVASALANIPQCDEGVLVQTKQGSILGQEGVSRLGRKYCRFLGIPYGEVAERFAEAVPASEWPGVLNASSYGEDCTKNEDCLYLNVFSPVLDIRTVDTLPVMFWIHGGAFQFGSSSSYGPQYFMDEDVVVITVNYRLGITGFFNLDVEGAPGNQGLKDIILALKWTQENLEAFGGDKNRVTVFGESAGGAAVSFLLLSPLSKGLFHRAISQSGTAFCPWAFHSNVKQTSIQVAESLGCTGMELEILECMRGLTFEEISQAQHSGILPTSFVNPMSFVPTVERRTAGRDSTIFLPKSPLEMAQSEELMDVPYIIGVNKYEAGVGSAIFSWFSQSTVHQWIPIFGPRTLGYLDRPDAQNISRAIQELYPVSPNDTDSFFSQLITDRTFRAPARLAARLHFKASPVYLYSFDRPGLSALVPFLTQYTPQHTDELQYLWDLRIPPYYGSHTITRESTSFNFSVSLVRSWVQFARTGRPSWNGDPKVWKDYEENDPLWFHIDENVELRPEDPIFSRKMDLWSRL